MPCDVWCVVCLILHYFSLFFTFLISLGTSVTSAKKCTAFKVKLFRQEVNTLPLAEPGHLLSLHILLSMPLRIHEVEFLISFSETISHSGSSCMLNLCKKTQKRKLTISSKAHRCILMKAYASWITLSLAKNNIATVPRSICVQRVRTMHSPFLQASNS